MARNRNEIIDTVKRYLDVLRENDINVSSAYLFGSHAAGNAGNDSDIDVAIITENLDGDMVDITVQLKLLTEKVDLDIWPHLYLREELEKAEEGSFLKEEILTKGILIH
ncbi:MAG: polymerase beta domain protein region [Clostridiales bacterium]|jgi:predicted nucleotidyltransferase|nr:polymerase beta domain protein region [Clostridiales bacterium]